MTEENPTDGKRIIRRTWGGVQVGNAAACGQICGISADSFQQYVRSQRPTGNPPPVAVTRDLATGQQLYPLDKVREWQASRPGPGNWGGIGARARRPERNGS